MTRANYIFLGGRVDFTESPVKRMPMSDQALPAGLGNGLIDFGNPQFPIDSFDMETHRVEADYQMFGYFIIGMPLCEQA